MKTMECCVLCCFTSSGTMAVGCPQLLQLVTVFVGRPEGLRCQDSSVCVVMLNLCR